MSWWPPKLTGVVGLGWGWTGVKPCPNLYHERMINQTWGGSEPKYIKQSPLNSVEQTLWKSESWFIFKRCYFQIRYSVAITGIGFLFEKRKSKYSPPRVTTYLKMSFLPHSVSQVAHSSGWIISITAFQTSCLCCCDWRCQLHILIVFGSESWRKTCLHEF